VAVKAVSLRVGTVQGGKNPPDFFQFCPAWKKYMCWTKWTKLEEILKNTTNSDKMNFIKYKLWFLTILTRGVHDVPLTDSNEDFFMCST